MSQHRPSGRGTGLRRAGTAAAIATALLMTTADPSAAAPGQSSGDSGAEDLGEAISEWLNNSGWLVAAPDRVDLRSQQTDIRDQGSRNTCTIFSTTAALEAAYLRAGHGHLDLSEQTLAWLNKMNWLEPNWSRVATADTKENQLGISGGGSGTEMLDRMVGGIAIPAEDAFAYRTTNYTPADHPSIGNPTAWWTQSRADDLSLDRSLLPRSALTAEAYHRPTGMGRIADPTDVAQLENVLASGREVIWDLDVPNTGTTWTPCQAGQANCPGGAHSVLVVGYDRSEQVLIVKNSWGPTSSAARDDGFSYLDYGVARYASSGSYITGVQEPTAWPELALVGQWEVSIGDLDLDATLDIYHVPPTGSRQLAITGAADTTDHRLGILRTDSGNVYRVNGSISGHEVEIRFDPERPNLDRAAWDGLRAYRFRLVENDQRLLPLPT